MQQKPESSKPISDCLLKILACPKCKGEVKLEDDKLVCQNCSRQYRIVDGIPVMIAED